MVISQLTLNHFRNFPLLRLSPVQDVNLIVGANGTGKTSILEAIYCLSTGKSFRTHQLGRMVQSGSHGFQLYTEIIPDEPYAPTVTAGIARALTGERQLRLQGETIRSMAEMARYLPVWMMFTKSYGLLQATSETRRRLLDWGMFHVEHNFYSRWQQYRQLLKQRNALIKSAQPITYRDAVLWDEQLIPVAEILHQLRAHWVEQLSGKFQEKMRSIMTLDPVPVIHYAPGWSNKESIAEVWMRSWGRDRQLGYTQYGPHRADLVVEWNQQPAEQILSLGQQKVVATVLQLATIELVQERTRHHCIVLVDDFTSELDNQHRERILQLLLQLRAQLFVTTIDLNAIPTIPGTAKVFHVQQGAVV